MEMIISFFNIQRINFKFETVLDFNIDIMFLKTRKQNLEVNFIDMKAEIYCT